MDLMPIHDRSGYDYIHFEYTRLYIAKKKSRRTIIIIWETYVINWRHKDEKALKIALFFVLVIILQDWGNERSPSHGYCS